MRNPVTGYDSPGTAVRVYIKSPPGICVSLYGCNHAQEGTSCLSIFVFIEGTL